MLRTRREANAAHLVFGGTDESERSHPDRLKVDISATRVGQRSTTRTNTIGTREERGARPAAKKQARETRQSVGRSLSTVGTEWATHVVTSNTVPKMLSLTKSAIATRVFGVERGKGAGREASENDGTSSEAIQSERAIDDLSAGDLPYEVDATATTESTREPRDDLGGNEWRGDDAS